MANVKWSALATSAASWDVADYTVIVQGGVSKTITKANMLAGYALLASPTFTGIPAAPTATPGTNTTQIATTAYTDAAVSAAGGFPTGAGRVAYNNNSDVPSTEAAFAYNDTTNTLSVDTVTVGSEINWATHDIIFQAFGTGTDSSIYLNVNSTGGIGQANLQLSGQNTTSSFVLGANAVISYWYLHGDSDGVLQWNDYTNTLNYDIYHEGNLPAAVRAVTLTGLSLASSADVVAGDTVLGAIGKLQAQADLGGGASGPIVYREETDAAYILELTDANTFLDRVNAASNTTQIPPNADVPFDLDTEVTLRWYGDGQSSITTGSGVTVEQPPDATLTLRRKGSACTIKKIATNNWLLIGDMQTVPVGTTVVTGDTTRTEVQGDVVLDVQTSSADITITLPTAVGNGAKFWVRKSDALVYLVIVEGAGAETINGSSNIELGAQYDSVILASDGNNWGIY